MRFEIFQGKNGQYFWRLKARNNQIIAQSEGYTRKSGVVRAVLSVKNAMSTPLLAVRFVEGK